MPPVGHNVRGEYICRHVLHNLRERENHDHSCVSAQEPQGLRTLGHDDTLEFKHTCGNRDGAWAEQNTTKTQRRG